MRLFLLSWLGLIFLVAGTAAAAETSPPAKSPEELRRTPVRTKGLVVDVRLGIGKGIESSLPVPLVISVENKINRRLNGTWEIELYTDKKEPRRVITQAMSLIDKGRKRLYLSIALQEDDTVIVRFRVDNRVLWQQKVLDEGTIVTRSRRSVPAILEAENLNLIVVDKQRRRILLPQVIHPNTNASMNAGLAEDSIPAVGSRFTASYTVNAWELPTRAQPYFGFKAVYFTKGTPPGALLPKQRQALADYLRWGGCVIFAPACADVRDTILAYLPKPAQPDIARLDTAQKIARSGSLQVIPVGAGELVFLGKDLAGTALAKDFPLRQKFYTFLEQRPLPSFPNLVGVSKNAYRNKLTPNAYNSFLWLAGLFIGYTLLSGPVVLIFLRKKKRRTIAWFVGGTIAGFSLISLLLGPILGMRNGDLEWLTVTELTPSGGNEWGIFTLTSAGGRRHLLDITGEDSRRWLLPAKVSRLDLQRGWWSGQAASLLTFNTNVSMDLLMPSSGRAALEVPLSPWGTRWVLANTYWAAGRSLPVRLTLDKHENLVATIKNTLPIPLLSPRLILGSVLLHQDMWRRTLRDSDAYTLGMNFIRLQEPAVVSGKKLKPRDLNLRRLLPGKSGRISVPLTLSLGDYGRDQSLFRMTQRKTTYDKETGESSENSSGDGVVVLPRVQTKGVGELWLIAKVAGSPALKSTRKSSFDSCRGFHFIVQRIPIDTVTAKLIKGKLTSRKLQR